MRKILSCLLASTMLAIIIGCGGGDNTYLTNVKPLVEQYRQEVEKLIEFEKPPYVGQQPTLDFYQAFSQNMTQLKTGICLGSGPRNKKLKAFHADFINLLGKADLMAQTLCNDLLRYQTMIAGTKFKNAEERKAEVKSISDKWEYKAKTARDVFAKAHNQLLPAFENNFNLQIPPAEPNPLVEDLKKSFK